MSTAKKSTQKTKSDASSDSTSSSSDDSRSSKSSSSSSDDNKNRKDVEKSKLKSTVARTNNDRKKRERSRSNSTQRRKYDQKLNRGEMSSNYTHKSDSSNRIHKEDNRPRKNRSEREWKQNNSPDRDRSPVPHRRHHTEVRRRNMDDQRNVDRRRHRGDRYNNDTRNDNNQRMSGRRDDYVRKDHRSREGRENNSNRQNPRQSIKKDESENYEWGMKSEKNVNDETSDQPEEKEKPNFGLSGKLTEDTNKVHGVVIKYSEPAEAVKPKRRWRLYPFKGETALPTLYIHRQSAYLIGRDRKICDLAVDHPSCSKQHAALQYRLVPYERVDGSTGKRVRPYLIDLESANGTFVNNKPIDSKKYVELLEKDVIKFGFSTREYVLLHESSKDEAEDDEVPTTET